MSEELFPLAVKSTIDKLGFDLAQAEIPPVKFIDLDNAVNTTALLSSQDNALVGELSILEPRPRDPMYQVSFSIGARTVNDPANYDIMTLVGKLKAKFAVNAVLEIRDYSGAAAGPIVGRLTVSQDTIMPQQYDKVSGIRLIAVRAMALRIG